MFRLAVAPFWVHCPRVRACLSGSRSYAVSGGGNERAENKLTVNSLYSLSVDIRKIRKLKGWVLLQDIAYVDETASVLKELGAEATLIATVLEQCPEAVLCTPAEVRAQRELWMSVCPTEKELLRIIEKFPHSFFTASQHINQKANIQFFQRLKINKRTIIKLMASASQSFSNPVEQNEQMISTLQDMYRSLGGKEGNLQIWLQKLLTQNPFILMKAPETLKENLKFLQKKGFSSEELLLLLSKLRGFIAELSPCRMEETLTCSKAVLRCTEWELKEIVLKCPALLYYSVPVLSDRLQGLLSRGISVDQIKESPSVLELTTQIVQYRIQKLSASGYDIKKGSLEPLNGTNKDFELSYEKLHLRKQRPLFNPVAPLTIEE
uniref:Mitochondrial transcription termination factor 2 n=1 Tax=Lepisosteus oculatus TaxID=7918 RepID=W5NMZ1_LEPOC|nr:PREDICTED: transcription termination factor 2, mitochondrial [Lepisosteus oculatus]XP_015207323.1 PREDICTED: transcription termination factor 2, mitochondrial [Lepisosteus oculatus]